MTAAGNCLRVEVLRGTHMPRMDWTGGADPYVVLAAQSEAGLQMFRCPSAWDTLVRPPSYDPRVPSEARFYYYYNGTAPLPRWRHPVNTANCSLPTH